MAPNDSFTEIPTSNPSATAVPPEALAQIASYLITKGSAATVASLMRLNQAAYDATAKKLYETVIITSKNASSVFYGLVGSEGRASAGETVKGRKGEKGITSSARSSDPAIGVYDDFHTLLAIGFPSVERDCWPAAVRQAHHRKSHLLSSCKKLVIAGVPPKSVGADMLFWSARDRALFPSVSHLTYTAGAIAELARWEEDELTADTTYKLPNQYDYKAAIKNLVHPQEMCVTCPKILDKKDLEKFSLDGWKAIPHSSLPRDDWRNSKQEWIAQLGAHVAEYIHGTTVRVIEDVVYLHETSLRILNTHGVHLSRFPKIPDIHHRVFMAACRSHPDCSLGQGCLYPYREYGLGCGTHWSSQLRSIARDYHYDSGKTTWELINLDSQGLYPDAPQIISPSLMDPFRTVACQGRV